ncbi:MAG: hypothetical protein WCT29_02540 [Candidatus Paceibacterota bacterium]|jgi:hypothetical protein
MKVIEKEEARVLRGQGKSINEIKNILKVSKASVSLWVRDVVLTTKQKNSLSQNGRSVASVEKRRLNRIASTERKTTLTIKLAKKEITSIHKNDLKMIGISLYLGEGGKTKRGIARITNSDPCIIKIMMRFFREICLVPENKFRGHIHTFSKTNIRNAENYWSKISGIPISQFYKTYIKPSTAGKNKRNTLPYGTLDVSVNDTQLFLKILGWMEKLKELAV